MRIVVALAVLLGAAVVFGTTLVSAEDEPKKPAPKDADPKKPAPKSSTPKQQPRGKGPSVSTLIWAREAVADRLKLGEKAPEFATDRDWLNVSRPLTLADDLKGKVVILDFWCYCCINCIHVLPDLEYLEERYKDQPFAVVGVHSAKFENEKDAAQIREAILRYEIHHPVVNDADFRIWRSYGARAWPTFAVIAPDGTFVGVLSGEGHRESLDALVQALLEHFGQTAPETLDRTALPMRLEKTTKPPGMLAYPGKVLAHPTKDLLYIADSGHNRIVEVKTDGTFVRAFGTGERGLVDGPADKARFFRPQGMALRDGVLWVCDMENHAIRTIDLTTGVVATAAGTGSKGNHWRLIQPGSPRVNHGPWPGKTTALNSPWDIEFLDGVGHIAMAGSHSMWSIDPKTNVVRHTAGDLSERRLDAKDPYKAAFAQPSGLATDGKVLFIADSESSAILRMVPGGAVTTLAGAEKDKPKNLFHFGDEDGVGWGKRFQHPMCVAYADGKVWVADAYNHKLKTLDPKTRAVAAYAGGGASGHADALPSDARFAEPSGLSWGPFVQDTRTRTLYVADTNNHVVRAQRYTFREPSDNPLNPRGDTRWAFKTLELKGVPIPMAHAKGGTTDAWPVMPGTATGPTVRKTVQVGKAFDITLNLGLPEGWKFTEGAPSVARVAWTTPEGASRFEDTKITSPATVVRVPAFEKPGVRGLQLRVLYYVCNEAGACRVRSIDFPVALTVSADPVPAGPVGVMDIFTP